MSGKLNLIEMSVVGERVRLVYANDQSKDQASEWVEVCAKVPGDDNRRLGVIQKDALLRLRALIDDEMLRFRKLSDQNHEQPL